MAVYVALLRGINVGKHRRVSMADLRDTFAAAGAEHARTYLQSGNVVFESSLGRDKVGARLEKELKAGLDLDVAVMVRAATDLRRILRRNPFAAQKDGTKVHVAFLESKPQPARVRLLDPDRVAPDAFDIAGREVFLHYPSGYGRSKLSNDYLEKQLGVRSTMRNWKTVTALAELAGGGRRPS
jgi:uncharacterized protein (DUF1697 family)